MLPDTPDYTERPTEIPRWGQVVTGLIVATLTLLLAAASLIGLVLNPSDKNPQLSILLGSVFLLLCVWLSRISLRLLTGSKNRGGLLSPRALRMVSLFFVIFPIAGLFTGYYRRMGPIAFYQAGSHFSGFFGLQALARKREATPEEQPTGSVPQING